MTVGVSSRPVADLTVVTMTVPDGAECYLCLDDRPDEAGKPLVRDCSCRGNAGVAHLSCLTMYAEQRSQKGSDKSDVFDVLNDFIDPWHKCNNCKQPFKNSLSRDLSSACVSFAETAHGHVDNSVEDKTKVMMARKVNIMTFINGMREVYEIGVDKTILRGECKMLIERFMELVDQIKKDMKMENGWVHMPQNSYEYGMFYVVYNDFEATGNNYWGMLYNWDGTQAQDTMAIETSYKKAIAYLTRARIIYNLVGNDFSSNEMEVQIIMIREKLVEMSKEGDANEYSAALFEKAKYIYEHNIESHGLSSVTTITSGFNYVNMLYRAHCDIQAERLISELAAISHRVHGPNHNSTIMAEKTLKQVQVALIHRKAIKDFIVH